MNKSPAPDAVTNQRQREELARFPAENPNPVLRLSRDGIVAYANDASEPLLRAWGAARGKSAPEFWRTQVREVLAEGTPRTIDSEVEGRLFSFQVVPIVSARYVDLFGTDRSEQRRAAETLAASELRYRRFFEVAQDGILIVDAETGMVVDVNQFLIELLGYSHDQFARKAIWDLGFLMDVVANQEHFRQLLQRKYVRYEDMPLETANGRRIAVEFVSYVYLVDGKRVIQCNIREVTARRRAEGRQELAAQVLAVLNRERDTHQHVGDLLRLFKTHTDIEAIGIRLREGDDFPYVETIGLPMTVVEAERHLCLRTEGGDLIRDVNGQPVLEGMCGTVLRGQCDPAKPFFTPHGSFWTNSTTALRASTAEKDPQACPRTRCSEEDYESVALIPLRAGETIIGLLRLTDHRPDRFTLEMIQYFEGLGASIAVALARQQAVASLRESEDRYRSLYVESRAAIVMVSPDRGFLGGNPAAITMFGCRDEQDLTSRTPGSLSPERQPDGLASTAKIQEMMRLALDTGSHFFEWTCRRVDGAVFPATVLMSRLEYGGQPQLLATVLDMTEQVRLEGQLRQAQKMETVGRLAGGVAHDFNNLLMGIIGYVELCQDQIKPGHPIREWLDEILRDAQRSAEITRQLLAFARKQAIVPRVLDFNDAVAGMLNLLQRLIGEDITLAWLPGAGLRRVRLDPSQVDQILANLCLNARDAIAGVGKITLETGNSTIDAEFCTRHADAIPGTYACLAVSDDGCGMDPETVAQIFEPFFTTKGLGKGTGLGLATVYGIVKQNNGFIDTYSEPGKGTTFKIYLPQVAAEAWETPGTRTPEVPTGRGETILLVEDEKSIRVTCSLFLDALGYHVLLAETPGEALKMADGHPGDIHLLLTDVVMPGMDGLQLAKRLGAARSGLRVLLMSGYTADVMAQRGVLEQGMSFIAKPFMRDDLARKVREVLEGPEATRTPTDRPTHA